VFPIRVDLEFPHLSQFFRSIPEHGDEELYEVTCRTLDSGRAERPKKPIKG
jgi:hypothetical protein